MRPSHLKPLPAGPFVLATWAKAKVGPDIHARVESTLYSVPWQQRPQLPDSWRGDPRLREQAGPQQLPQDRGIHLVVF
ncbi:MAG: Mu transposase domain-containing protein, partial [Micromonosporaceae bacterium]